MGISRPHLSSRGRKAIFTGDNIQHPLEASESDWSTTRCTDIDLAIESRRRIAEKIADTEIKLITAYSPGHTVGYILSKGNDFKFRYFCLD